MPPFAKAAVVEEFEFFGDNEEANAAVTVLEGVDAFKLAVEVDDVFQGWAAIFAWTCSGGQVSLPPTSFGRRL